VHQTQYSVGDAEDLNELEPKTTNLLHDVHNLKQYAVNDAKQCLRVSYWPLVTLANWQPASVNLVAVLSLLIYGGLI